MNSYKGSALRECHHPAKMLFEIEWVPKATGSEGTTQYEGALQML